MFHVGIDVCAGTCMRARMRQRLFAHTLKRVHEQIHVYENHRRQTHVFACACACVCAHSRCFDCFSGCAPCPYVREELQRVRNVVRLQKSTSSYERTQFFTCKRGGANRAMKQRRHGGQKDRLP